MKNNSLKIGITGSNNTGKSSLANGIHVAVKNKLNRSAEIAQESIRECPLGIKENTTISSSAWIFTRQVQLELIAAKYDEVVISDKTSIDTLAYANRVFNKNDNNSDRDKNLLNWLEQAAIEWAKTYDLLFYLPILEDSSFNDWVEGENHQSEIDIQLKTILKKYNIPFITVTENDLPSRVSFVVNHLIKEN